MAFSAHDDIQEMIQFVASTALRNIDSSINFSSHEANIMVGISSTLLGESLTRLSMHILLYFVDMRCMCAVEKTVEKTRRFCSINQTR